MSEPRGPGRPSEYSDEDKANALTIYIDSGPAAAARLTGIPSGTIRSWAARTPGMQQARTKQTQVQIAELRARSEQTWTETCAELVDVISGAAAALAHVVHDKIEDSNLRDAKDAAITLGILIDKANLLAGGTTSRVAVEVESHEVLTSARSKVLKMIPGGKLAS